MIETSKPISTAAFLGLSAAIDTLLTKIKKLHCKVFSGTREIRPGYVGSAVVRIRDEARDARAGMKAGGVAATPTMLELLSVSLSAVTFVGRLQPQGAGSH